MEAPPSIYSAGFDMSSRPASVVRDGILVVLGGTLGIVVLMVFAPWSSHRPEQPVLEATTPPSSGTAASTKTLKREPAQSTRSGAEYARLKAKVQALENALSALTQRNARSHDVNTTATGQEGASNSAQPAPEETGVVQSFVEQLQEDNSPVRAAVQGMIDDAWQNRRQEWRAVRSASRDARNQDRIQRFSAQVDLKAEQQDAIATAIADESDKIREIRRAARENLDFEGLREKVQSVKNDTDEGLAEMLNSEQIEAWKVFRAEEWRGRFR